MSQAVELLETLGAIGVTVKVEGTQLLVKDPGKKISPDLRQKLKRYKAEIMRQVVINEVASYGENELSGPLTNEELSDRLLALKLAFDAGIIDQSTKDQGVGFLLQNWDVRGHDRQ